MTIKPMTLIKTVEKRAQFPDFPPRQDMQNWLYLYRRSFPTALTIYLGSPETTVTGCEIPLSPGVGVSWRDVRIPDMVVSRNSSPGLVVEQKGYAIDSQGKPPDFVLEVASQTTGEIDYTEKRSDYERYGVLEYWRFDPTRGDYHDAALAGDRLVDGKYESIPIEWLDDNRCRGYSDALGLYLCWEYGELLWYDPAAEAYLQTHEADYARADSAEARAEQEAMRAEQESERADHAEAQAEREAERAARAEAELRRLRQKLDDDEPDK